MQHPLGMLLKCCLSNLTHLITSVPFADRCPLSSEQASSVEGESQTPEQENERERQQDRQRKRLKHPDFPLPNYNLTPHLYIPTALIVDTFVPTVAVNVPTIIIN